MGRTLGENLMSDIEHVKRQSDAPAAEATIIRKQEETVKIIPGPVVISGSDWTGSVGSVFILSNLKYGILGSHRLGSGNGPLISTYRVVNTLNTYREYFRVNDFIDTTNSTGSWAYYPTPGSFGYYTTLNQIFQTKIIYKNAGSLLGSVTPAITYTGSYTFQASGNNGTTWVALTNNTGAGITGSELLFRATCSASPGSITALEVLYELA